MPHEAHLKGAGELPEGMLVSQLAMITVLRQSNCSYWMAADENGAPEGTFMVVCVLGPGCIADLQAALQVCMEKWDSEEENETP